jgi:hypothetical protein
LSVVNEGAAEQSGCAGDARFNPDNIIIGSRQANIIAITKFHKIYALGWRLLMVY